MFISYLSFYYLLYLFFILFLYQVWYLILKDFWLKTTIVFERTKIDFLHISKNTYFRNVTWRFYRQIPKTVDKSLRLNEL